MSVVVDAVAPRDRAQPRQIQVRVLDLQRIKGPLQQLDSVRNGVITLRQLQPPSQTVVAIALPHGQHVRMEISMTGAAPGNGESEADQITAIKGANDLASDLLAHHEHAQRNRINIVKFPDLFLQHDAGIQLIHALTLANGDLLRAGNSYTHFGPPSSV